MLALFLGRSHLQYLIAYSMQILEVGRPENEAS